MNVFLSSNNFVKIKRNKVMVAKPLVFAFNILNEKLRQQYASEI